MLERFRQDFWYSLRSLSRAPLFTLAVLLTLGLGIGANSAIFSVVNEVLLQNLPYDDPDELVTIWESNEANGQPKNEVAPANYFDWRDQTTSFEEMATYVYQAVNLTGDGRAERIQAAFVSPELMRILGQPPSIGRLFDTDDLGEERSLLLSHGLWQSRYGSDPDIAGKTLQMNGRAARIVGVMPPEFDFPREDVQLWILFEVPEGLRGDRQFRFLYVLARLAEGVSVEAARDEMTAVAGRLEEAYPDSNENWGMQMIPLHEHIVGDVRPALRIILGTTLFVLLIAATNVANLMLARATSREKEVATRIAMGAGRGRLLQQFFVESLIITVLGAGLGLALAYGGIQLLLAFNPDYIPRIDAVAIDGPVLLFTGLMTLLTGLFFGLVPAFKIPRSGLPQRLKEGGRTSSASTGTKQLRYLLVITETALALVLLVGSGLMVRSLISLQQVDPGFSPDGALTFEVNVPASSRYDDNTSLTQFYERLVDRLESIPGVSRAGATTNLPLGGSNMSTGFVIEGQPVPEGGEYEINFRRVSPGYRQSLEVPLITGRDIEETDTADSPRVVLVNQAFVERYSPNGNPLDLRLDVHQEGQMEVAGVIGDVRHWSLDQPPEPEIYLPYSQSPDRFATLVVKTRDDPEQLKDRVRQEVQALDSEIPLSGLRSLEEVYASSIARSNLYTRLLTLFAGLALVLAAIGIYGIMGYSTSQRTREIGVRMALGAQRGDVLKLVVGQGLRLVVLGTAAGLVIAYFLSRYLDTQLYQVTSTDPATMVLTTVVLLVVATLACYLPARRASRVEPTSALRES
jgi:putative ABC transport system permease protein